MAVSVARLKPRRSRRAALDRFSSDGTCECLESRLLAIFRGVSLSPAWSDRATVQRPHHRLGFNPVDGVRYAWPMRVWIPLSAGVCSACRLRLRISASQGPLIRRRTLDDGGALHGTSRRITCSLGRWTPGVSSEVAAAAPSGSVCCRETTFLQPGAGQQHRPRRSSSRVARLSVHQCLSRARARERGYPRRSRGQLGEGEKTGGWPPCPDRGGRCSKAPSRRHQDTPGRPGGWRGGGPAVPGHGEDPGVHFRGRRPASASDDPGSDAAPCQRTGTRRGPPRNVWYAHCSICTRLGPDELG